MQFTYFFRDPRPHPITPSIHRQPSRPLRRITTGAVVAGLFTVFGIGAATASSTPPPLPPEAGLAELIRYAVENRPDLKARTSRAAALAARSEVEGGLPDPMIGYSYFAERMETRQTLEVRQTIPWPGVRAARRDALLRAATATESEAGLAGLALAEEVTAAHAERARLQGLLAVLREAEDLESGWITVVQSRVEAGAAGPADLLRAEVFLESIRDEIERVGEEIQIADTELNRLLGRPAGAGLPRVEAEDLVRAAALLRSATAVPETGHPVVAASRAGVEQARFNERAARLAARPDFTLGAEWMENTDRTRDEFRLMVGISLPIWGGRNEALRTAARQERLAAEASLDDNERLLAAERRSALDRHREAQRRADFLAETLIPRTREILRLETEAYTGGSGDLFTLIATNRELLNQEETRLAQEARALRAAARLAFLNASFPGFSPDQPQRSEQP